MKKISKCGISSIINQLSTEYGDNGNESYQPSAIMAAYIEAAYEMKAAKENQWHQRG